MIKRNLNRLDPLFTGRKAKFQVIHLHDEVLDSAGIITCREYVRFENHTNIWAKLAHTAIDEVWDSFSRTLIYIILLRRLKVAILKWLIPLALNNGPVADSGIQLPIPLILWLVWHFLT